MVLLTIQHLLDFVIRGYDMVKDYRVRQLEPLLNGLIKQNGCLLLWIIMRFILAKCHKDNDLLIGL